MILEVHHLILKECGDTDSLNKATQTEGESLEETRYNIAELTEQGQRIIVVHTGEGGLGSVCAPNVSRKLNCKNTVINKDEASDLEVSDADESLLRTGLPGSEAVLMLELKSIADVRLMGMPNAGKSTLPGALSRAKPRVGHHTFTTLQPNLGNMNFDDFSITVVDFPGLI